MTKPLLERQRRARINKCLDSLKEILTSGLQSDSGENVARLEKADILELAVRHLQKLTKNQQKPTNDDDRFKAGFASCAGEVSRVLATITPTIDVKLGSSIMIHLGHSLNQITSSTSARSSPAPSPRSPSVCSSTSTSGDYRPYTPYTPPASPTESHFSQLSPMPLNMSMSSSKSNPWRPW